MNVASQIQLNKQLKSNITRLMVLSGVLLVSNLLLSAVIFRQDLKVLLVPTYLNEKIMMTTGEASEKYLEKITREFIGLLLNLTPENYAYASEKILENTHPSSHGVIRHELTELAEDIKGRNIAISFSITGMEIDKKSLKVDIVGYKETKIGLTITDRKLHTYRITYGFIDTRLWIKEFYEVKDESL